MEELNLQVGEYVVYECTEDSIIFEKKGGWSFYVTNLNIVLVKEETHFFRKSTYQIEKFPISNIRHIDGAPQVAVEENEYEDTWDLVVLFQDGLRGLKRFSFEWENKKKDKVKMDKIAEILTQLSSRGTIVLKEGEKKTEPVAVAPTTKSDAPTEKKPSLMEKISGGMKGIIRAVTGDKEEQTEEESKYCLACGAKMDMDAKFCPNCGAMQSSGR